MTRARACLGAAVLAIVGAGGLVTYAVAGEAMSPESMDDAALLHVTESPKWLIAPAEAIHLRTRTVEVDFAALEALDPAGGDRLSLTLFDDVTVSARFDRLMRRAEDQFTWTGRLGAGDDIGEWFVLVRTGDALVANFWTADGRGFEIRPAGEETAFHFVHEIQLAAFDPCKVCAGANCGNPQPAGALVDAHDHASSPPMPLSGNGSPCGSDDDGSQIDVLVVYTPAARIAAGGTAAIEGLAHAAVAATNEAYQNSQVETTIHMVHVAEVDYTESGSFNTDLSNLHVGNIPGVHAMRDEYAADLVALLNTAESFCGIAYLMTSLSPNFESWAFSVTRYSCAVGNLTFAHELGHNMGCAHDTANAGAALFPYSYGWRWTTTWGQLRRSVMAYSPGVRVPHFSNPDVLNGGAPTGVPIGEPDQAHNAHSINEAAYTVANFRTSICPVPDESLCGNAIEVSEGTIAFSNHGATTDGPPEPELCNLFGDNQIQSDIWFVHEAQCSGMLVVDLCDADFSVKASAYLDGCPAGPGEAVWCNILGCENGSGTLLHVAVDAGDLVRIRLGGHLGSQGTGMMSITCDACPADIAGPNGSPDGEVDVFDLISLINAWGECTLCPADLSGPAGQPDGVVDVLDLIELINSWGSCGS